MRVGLYMLRCLWSGRRIQRYLDADPTAPLSKREKKLLEAHLAVCEYCAQTCAEQRALKRALSKWQQPRNESELVRLRAYAEAMLEGDPPTAGK